MQQLHNHEVMGFDTYQTIRANTRSEMITTRKARSVQLTDNIRVIFENKQTVRYQIEEVMYASRSSCRNEIDAQISTYQHLLPTGNSLKATLMLEYPDELIAGLMLSRLKGIESTIYLQIGEHERIWPLANEDIQGQLIISPVHYLSFALNQQQKHALLNKSKVRLGIAHGHLNIAPVILSAELSQQLTNDLAGSELS